MKDTRTMGDVCFHAFVAEHPELTVNTGNLVTQMMTSEKTIYSRVAIDFAIKYMIDEQALSKKARK